MLCNVLMADRSLLWNGVNTLGPEKRLQISASQVKSAVEGGDNEKGCRSIVEELC